MFRSALIGIDPAPAEQALLSCLPDLRRWNIDRLVLVHIAGVGYVQAGGLGHEADYLAWLEERAVALRAAGFAVDVALVHGGDTAQALLETAVTREVDLVVVGSRSRNFLNRLFLGSVARETVRRARLPVLIEWLEPAIEGDGETCAAVCGRALDHVLLATDLSPQSAAAAAAAIALAPRAGRVDCLTVLPATATADECAMARQKLAVIAAEVARVGGQGSIVVEKGEVMRVIGRTAEAGPSLIIVGKNGQNWVAGKVIGSTAAWVCEHAGRPVLMVPCGT